MLGEIWEGRVVYLGLRRAKGTLCIVGPVRIDVITEYPTKNEIRIKTTRACRSRDGSTIPRFVGVVRVLLLEIQRL